MKLALDAALLAFESQQVIGLRLPKMAFGGAVASREANLMVTEKATAFTQAAAKIAAGAEARSVVKGYHKQVRANRRRLTR